MEHAVHIHMEHTIHIHMENSIHHIKMDPSFLCHMIKQGQEIHMKCTGTTGEDVEDDKYRPILIHWTICTYKHGTVYVCI